MTQGSIARPKTQKNPRPRSRTDFLGTDPLEAKGRNALRQGPRKQRASKKIFAEKNRNLSETSDILKKKKKKKKKGLHKPSARSLAFSKTKKKKVVTLAHF